jgi:hypothetical protein
MLINKQSLEFASKFVGNNDVRYALSGVLIERDTLVATDGHMLAVVNHGTDCSSADYPAVPNYAYPDAVDYYANGVEPIQPTLVHVDGVKQITKAMPKLVGRAKYNFPVLNNVLIDVERSNLNGSLYAHVTDLENPQALTIKKMDGRFPDYKGIMPQDAPCYSVSVNPAYLKQIGEAYTKLGDIKMVTMEFWPDALRPIRITGKRDEHEATVLLMPIKGEGKGLTSVKAWAETVCGMDLSGYDIS